MVNGDPEERNIITFTYRTPRRGEKKSGLRNPGEEERKNEARFPAPPKEEEERKDRERGYSEIKPRTHF